MISIEQEESIYRMIKNGSLDSYIELVTGSSHQSIGRMRKIINLVESMEEEKREKIKELLANMTPVGAIEVITKTPRINIAAIRRYYYLHRTYTKYLRPRKCPTCGNLIPRKFTEKINDKSES